MLNANRQWKERWIKSRLHLDHHHPDVISLEDSIFDFCQRFARCPARGRRMVIYGNNGNGKTHVTRCVHRWVCDRALDLPLVAGTEGAKIADSMFVNWAERVDDFRGGDWDIEEMVEATLLVLDDIGAEHDPSKFSVEKLYLILERRAARWTLITTNLLPAQWEEHFDRRIADRLFRNTEHVDFSAVPSYSINT